MAGQERRGHVLLHQFEVQVGKPTRRQNVPGTLLRPRELCASLLQIEVSPSMGPVALEGSKPHLGLDDRNVVVVLLPRRGHRCPFRIALLHQGLLHTDLVALLLHGDLQFGDHVGEKHVLPRHTPTAILIQPITPGNQPPHHILLNVRPKEGTASMNESPQGQSAPIQVLVQAMHYRDAAMHILNCLRRPAHLAEQLHSSNELIHWPTQFQHGLDLLGCGVCISRQSVSAQLLQIMLDVTSTKSPRVANSTLQSLPTQVGDTNVSRA